MRQQELKLFDDRQIFSVAQVVGSVKTQLESQFHDIWVRGEISNVRTPPSGHLYFSMKDAEARLKVVCFRMQHRLLKFRPEDGMEIIARGSLTVYSPRGEFQLVAKVMEPVGPGALQIAFEQLKTRLQREGLFDPAYKKRLPLLPAKIGVISSPTGAAIQDILKVLKWRNDRLNVLLFPAKVQGSGAAQEIVRGIKYFNERLDIDVIMVARGGGSLEDLWAFNEENVARAIFDSRIPLISAVGHEIDFTISDFVSDLRASTPSAAAETVSGAREELWTRIEGLVRRSGHAVRLCLTEKRHRLQRLVASRAFVDAESKLRFFLQRLDELHTRLVKGIPSQLEPKRQRVPQLQKELEQQIRFLLYSRKQLIQARTSELEAFSPLSVLHRGYAIVTTEVGSIIRDPKQLKIGERMDIRVAKGKFRAQKLEKV